MPFIRVKSLAVAAGAALCMYAFLPSVAVAADATLCIKVRLVRCITQSERQTLCDSESLCCEFIDGFDHQADAAEKDANRLQPSPASIWISAAPPPQKIVSMSY